MLGGGLIQQSKGRPVPSWHLYMLKRFGPSGRLVALSMGARIWESNQVVLTCVFACDNGVGPFAHVLLQQIESARSMMGPAQSQLV